MTHKYYWEFHNMLIGGNWSRYFKREVHDAFHAGWLEGKVSQ